MMPTPTKQDSTLTTGDRRTLVGEVEALEERVWRELTPDA